MVNIAGIIYDDLGNGDGVRVTCFFSGCIHHCKGCQNPEAQNSNYGTPFTSEIEDKIIQYCIDNEFISGITLSGGDPMEHAYDLLGFVKRFKKLTKKNVWCYTGYTYEEILDQGSYKKLLLDTVDVLVDGKFDIGHRDTTLGFRGSPNQRIIDVKASKRKKQPVDISAEYD